MKEQDLGGTSNRAGPPCSAGSGSPSKCVATMAFPSIRSATGRFVVYPPSQCAITYMSGADVSPAAFSRSSNMTPRQRVSNFDHLVTQWMSKVRSVCGRASNSVQFQRASCCPPLCTVRDQLSSGVRCVAPAVRTGKSWVTYCPGGSRSVVAAASRCLPLKPLVTFTGNSSPRHRGPTLTVAQEWG